jgi:hypothetical protein
MSCRLGIDGSYSPQRGRNTRFHRNSLAEPTAEQAVSVIPRGIAAVIFAGLSDNGGRFSLTNGHP